MFLRIVLTFLLCTPLAHSAVEKMMDEKASLHVTFSRQSHNRISVEHGSIRKLFGDQSLFSVTIDDVIGQAFVTLLQDISETPASLTVVTSSGFVQDLLVLSEAKPSEHLILKEMDEEGESLSFFSTDFHAHTIDFLNDLLAGKTPLGYGKRSLQVGDQLEMPPPLQVTPLRVFEGPYETIVVYQIGNSGRKPIVINADLIKKPGDNWVFLDSHELDFTENALCIISSPKD